VSGQSRPSPPATTNGGGRSARSVLRPTPSTAVGAI
jgi:hypothetical protein